MTIWFKIVAPSHMSYEDGGNCLVACSQICVHTENEPDALVECVCVSLLVYKSSHVCLPVCVAC